MAKTDWVIWTLRLRSTYRIHNFPVLPFGVLLQLSQTEDEPLSSIGGAKSYVVLLSDCKKMTFASLDRSDPNVLFATAHDHF